MWITIVAKEGWSVGLHTSWILLIVLSLAGWTLLMRLRYSPARLERTIGRWQTELI